VSDLLGQERRTTPIAIGAVPIFMHGAAAGALSFAFSDERLLNGDERAYLEILAAHAAEAVQRSRLRAQLVDALEVRQAMIQASPAAIMLLDPEGCVQAWNAAAERIFGYRDDEVIGRFLPVVPADRRDEFLGNVRAVLDGQVFSGVEAVRVDREGHPVDVTLYAAPVRRTNGTTLCLSMVVDVSERKRIERGRQLVADVSRVLTRSLDWEDTVRQAVDVPVPAFADWASVHLLVDGKLCCLAMTGVTEIGEVAPVVHDPLRPGLSMAVATGRAQIATDIDADGLRAIARDDAHLALLRTMELRSFMAVPMRAGGDIIGGFSFGSRTRNFDALDLTVGEAIASQAASAIENARLFRDATSARAAAEAANQAKDQFLAMLGHELRNPLAPMRTALELMALDEPAPSRSREVLERQVAHLTRLVDDLLDVSRITRGKIEIVRTGLVLAEIVARAVELTSPLFEQRRHSLAVEVPAELAVDGDAVRLAQVVANLLSNAARYTPPGGTIRLRAWREGGEIVLVVSDNGQGIAAETLPTIFDMFVQGAQSTARTEGGLGLGLSIVRSLVELHGGRVVARSAGPGAGSEFEVRLPALAAAAVASAGSPLARGSLRPTVRRRILVVDDNQDAARLLAELLEARGHDVRTAFDGPDALRVADRFRPELAFLDLGLPVMDGYELAERLRASTAHASLHLVALSGYSQESDRSRTRAAGFHHHLAKPVSMDAVFEVIEGSLRRSAGE
jgi:PAS domain S-box-containing protein